MAANRLAKSSPEWVNVFQRHNDGAYNNQWMILDYKLFTPGKPLLPNTFWVAEQIPGTITSMDASHILQAEGYWASYNVPYFNETFLMGGW